MAEKIGVFVSHHHSPEEDAFTARLVADLEAAGADVWVDYHGIASGSFVAKISQGLAARQWLVLVMTPASLASQWVQLEVDTAIAEQRAGRMLGVIPFVMLPCKDTDVPHLWRTFQRYDATTGYEAARDGVLRALRLSLPGVTGDPQLARKDAASKPTSADATVPTTGATPKVHQPNFARLRSLNGLQSLSFTKFIDAVALMLTANGYRQVERTWSKNGADIECVAPDGRKAYVTCIRDTMVFENSIRDALYDLRSDKIPFGDDSAEPPERAIIVTTAWFIRDALNLAKRHADEITLIDGQQLVTMMQRVQPQ